MISWRKENKIEIILKACDVVNWHNQFKQLWWLKAHQLHCSSYMRYFQNVTKMALFNHVYWREIDDFSHRFNCHVCERDSAWAFANYIPVWTTWKHSSVNYFHTNHSLLSFALHNVNNEVCPPKKQPVQDVVVNKTWLKRDKQIW